MFLTLKQFLSYFEQGKLDSLSKAKFLERFKIMYSTPQTLDEIWNFTPIRYKKDGSAVTILKTNQDQRYLQREEINDYFYEIIITNREKYLSLFYQAYFSFEDPMTLNWVGLNLNHQNNSISVQKNDASRRLIRNLFYLELLDYTKVTNTVKSKVSFWDGLIGMYNRLELEDRFFAPSSLDLFLRKKGKNAVIEINYNNLFYLYQAYQPKASIFNPYAIKGIIDDVLKPETGTLIGKCQIFTPVLSWASYLTAFMHSEIYNTYVGVDVMPSVCQKADFLGNWYRNTYKISKKVRIICSPSEDLLQNYDFTNKYYETFDSIIFCPPYFDMETYHEGKQSILRYPNYYTWLKEYLEQTIQLCYHVLKVNGKIAIIINDYNTLDRQFYPLIDDTKKILEFYFQYLNIYNLQNRTSPLRVNKKNRTEKLLVFMK